MSEGSSSSTWRFPFYSQLCSESLARLSPALLSHFPFLCLFPRFEGYRILSKSCQGYTGQVELARGAANELAELWMPVGSVWFSPQRAFSTMFTPTQGQGWGFLLSILGSVGSVRAAGSQQQNTAPTTWGSSSMDKPKPGAAPSLDHLQLLLWRGFGTGFLPFSCCLQLQDTSRIAAASPTSLNQIQPGKLTPAPAQRRPLPRGVPQRRFFIHSRRLFLLTLLKTTRATL